MNRRMGIASGLSGLKIQGRKLMLDITMDETKHVSLCESLDRILNKGAVVVGEVTISVANIDLIYLGLQLILTSVETAREMYNPVENR